MKRKIIITSLVLIGLLASTLLVLYFRWSSLPVYTFDQNSLKIGENVFDSGPTEFELEPIKLGKRIGRTEEGFRVYEIMGQNLNNWVYVRGLMFEGLYRNQKIPYVNIERLHISEILLIQGSKLIKRTSDQLILNETREALFKQTSKLTRPQETMKTYNLRLITEELPGLAVFTSYCCVTERNEIFISKRIDDSWFKAGNQLSKWVLSK